MSKRKGRIAFVLCSALVLNVVVGYAIAFFVYLSSYKLPSGLELFRDEFVKQPSFAISTLLGRDGLEKINQLYFHPGTQIVFWSYIAWILWKIVSRGMTAEKNDAHEFGSHGTSRWSSNKEITERFIKTSEGFVFGKTNGKNGKILCHPFASRLNQFVFVVGGSGSGKSWSIVIPNILHISSQEKGGSMIITDPKGEIYNKTSNVLRQRGYKIAVFNLLDMTRSDRHNPLDYVFDVQDAFSLANTIIRNTSGENNRGDKFWEQAEQSLISALILYIKETRPPEEHHIANVFELGLSLGDDPEVVDNLFMSLNELSAARQAYRIFNQSEDKVRSSILTGFGVRFQLWISQEVIELTSGKDIDLNDFGEPDKKVALFILIRPADNTFDVLPSILLDQIFQTLYKKAEQMPDNRLATPVRLILDELANIAPIAGLKRKIATMRGYGISAFLIFQSKSQFEDRYGKSAAQEIIDSCDTRMLLGSNDPGTHEYFSQLLGRTTLQIESLSESESSRNASQGRSKTFIERRLMTPDEIGRLDPNELIIFQRGQYPVKTQKAWADDKEIKQYETHWKDAPPRSRGVVSRIKLAAQDEENVPEIESVQTEEAPAFLK